MMRRKRLQVAAWATCMAILLTGCGAKAPVGTSEDEVQPEIPEQESASGISGMQAVNGQRWTQQMTFGSAGIYIDAEISVPDMEEMQIISVEAQSMGPENRKALLSKFCEKPYVLDRWNPPKCYKNLNQPWLEKAKKEKEEGIDDGFDEECVANQLALLAAWNNQTEPGEEKESDNYEELSYYGDYEGRTYFFSFRSDDGVAIKPLELGRESEPSALGGAAENIRCLYFEPADYEGLTNFKPQTKTVEFSAFGMDSGISGENACGLSVEEAEKEAITFLEKLGYTGIDVDRVNHIGWDDGVQPTYLDGYQIVFYRNIDGIPLNEEKVSYGCQKHGYFEYDRGITETYKIYVTDAGVIAGSLQSPYVQKEIVSTGTKLLSFEQAKEVFESLLTTDETYYNNPCAEDINALRLTYGLQNKDGKCAIVPVWRLEHQDTTYDAVAQEDEIWQCSSVIMINAIDGSVIDPGDEMEE